MAQFCGDIKCEFYDTFPDGFKFAFCPFCTKPLVAEKPSLPEVTDPQLVDQTIEKEESFVEIESCPNVVSNQFITPIYNWGATREKNLESRYDIRFEDVIVTFSTAVLKKHYLIKWLHFSQIQVFIHWEIQIRANRIQRLYTSEL